MGRRSTTLTTTLADRVRQLHAIDDRAVDDRQGREHMLRVDNINHGELLGTGDVRDAGD